MNPFHKSHHSVLRQHVNPLSSFYQVERDLLSIAELFENPNLPLHLDIGCARGRFLLALAPQRPHRNHLGLEIRRPLVDLADADQKRLEINNLRFLFCNANISLENWLTKLPANLLTLVTIQYPDPWFKKRHHKRRMVQPELIASLAAAMAPDGQLFLQSDVPQVIQFMLEAVANSDAFYPLDGGTWLETNPFCLATEREAQVLDKKLPVYRRLFSRSSASIIQPL
ncbi:MAG: tRNA (guanosine(46)-N7)-methyltransferase TrmB [Synechococcaceae bacterium WBB_32_011]|nr:tRNA (guanosine(46)-N7)-methyltransferase TrmB [Synechococcaceae bacterium WB6_1A_059]NBP98468.1 tRNA (guanosine(46)-N7)-methyltransferase TrmB [Synechococcaceae bacterium WB6_3A_227]NBQ18570.1 tRNA (guanosine(46)-N7)-methyltransferase TrmB [Synechococcaceae bacterium WB5_2A_257]NCU76198.1 tRNA (guanosine(46)-N7)-methyltransferase TrmB [Synechococcaceae bacterium WB7_1C_051]NDA75787.1 tRNA (guanosine(46)-N7)-methyltransferase TrmB [Synechococcaceae bacterium WB8_3_299]NDC06294.1 tRNA (guano